MANFQNKSKAILVSDLLEFLNSTGIYPKKMIQNMVNVIEEIMDNHHYKQTECTLLNVFSKLKPDASQEENQLASLLAEICDILKHSQRMLSNILENDNLCCGTTTSSKHSDFIMLDCGMDYIMQKRFGHLGEVYSQLVTITRVARLKTYQAQRILSEQNKNCLDESTQLLDYFSIQNYENYCKIKSTGQFGTSAALGMTLSGVKKQENPELFKNVELICEKIELCGMIKDDILEVFGNTPQANETCTNININQNSFLFLMTRQHCRSETEWNELKTRFVAENAESKEWIFNLMVELQIHKKAEDFQKNLEKEIRYSIQTQLGIDGNLVNMLSFLVDSMVTMCSRNKRNSFSRLQRSKIRTPVHFQHEELFLKHYPMFGEHMEINEKYNRSFKCIHKRAIYFLERSCSAKYGFPGQIHHPEKDYESCYGIATSFDSALLLPFLINENFDPDCLNGLVRAINIHSRPSGFWGYFDSIDENDTAFFPPDIDDTSIPMLALFVTGNKSAEECQANVRKMEANALKDSTGAMGTWLPNLDKAPSGEPRKFLYTKPFTEIKMDVSCLVNFLCYASVVGLDRYEAIQPSVKFVAKFVDQLVENLGRATVPKDMIYYPKFPTLLFLSRYTYHSPNARSLFGDKLKVLVKEEILQADIVYEKAMNIACCILAALYLNLHEDQEADDNNPFKTKLHEMYSTLLSLQGKDGSFNKAVLFKATHFGHYGGSRFVSTGLAVSAIGRYYRQVVHKLVGTAKVY